MEGTGCEVTVTPCPGSSVLPDKSGKFSGNDELLSGDADNTGNGLLTPGVLDGICGGRVVSGDDDNTGEGLFIPGFCELPGFDGFSGCFVLSGIWDGTGFPVLTTSGISVC